MRIESFERGLKDRVAVVTGASVGNGRALCERLAEEGAKIVVVDIASSAETVRAVQALGGTALEISADVTKQNEVARLFEEVLATFGTVDILVHNVGCYEEEPFHLISYERWNNMMNVTLNSLFVVVQAVLPVMKKNGFGRIITFSSDTVWLGTPFLTHYITAKMGVIGFTRSLSAEVGMYGITINTVSVGLTATQSITGAEPASSILAHILPAQAVHRPDEPEDIANVVAFLAMPASGIITGQTINVDGGVAKH